MKPHHVHLSTCRANPMHWARTLPSLQMGSPTWEVLFGAPALDSNARRKRKGMRPLTPDLFGAAPLDNDNTLGLHRSPSKALLWAGSLGLKWGTPVWRGLSVGECTNDGRMPMM